jgi:hypothetical protein
VPETLEIDDFTPLVGTVFTIALSDGLLELSLESVEAHGRRAPRPDMPGFRSRPFSLFFSGPLEPVLPQRTRDLAHPKLGTQPIFLVPIGPGAGRMRYEAVFN